MLSESLALSEAEWVEALLIILPGRAILTVTGSSTPLRSAQNDN
jgi:hypothetical protein